MKTKSTPTGLTKRKSTGSVVDTIKTVVYAVLIALAVRTVAYEPFNIPSGSMVPTYNASRSNLYGKTSVSSSRKPFSFMESRLSP